MHDTLFETLQTLCILEIIINILLTKTYSYKLISYSSLFLFSLQKHSFIFNLPLKLYAVDKPQFLASALGVAVVVEGGTLVLNATAVGNPTTMAYQWTYLPRRYYANFTSSACAAASNSSTTVPVTSPLLVLDYVTRNNSGTFCCAARNTEGVSWLPFTVDVKCKQSQNAVQ